MTERRDRVDGFGRAYAGSQLQIQIYVNRRPDELSQHTLKALPSLASLGADIRWVSPLESERFVEYQDRAFLRAIGLDHLASQLSGFWPSGGPVWDALAAVEFREDPNQRGVILVEAKSHPSEVYGGGCKASPRSRKKIQAALNDAKRWLGVSEEADWTGPLYQSANRLAHLYFFQEVAGIPAWLVNVYFLDDPHSPTTLEEWQPAIAQVKTELGLARIATPHSPELFLQARDRQELVSAQVDQRSHFMPISDRQGPVMKLWSPGETLSQVEGIKPLLASWERKTHPAQVRLQAYLDELASAVEPLPGPPATLFLHMDIDVQEPGRLLHHCDLENYLTPVVFRLGARRFQLVTAQKRVGGGSRLLIGLAQPLKELEESRGWQHFACSAGAGAQTKGWKANLRKSLAASELTRLPSGPVEVRLAWRCSPQRNWVWLWKPTLDAMGPVLGEPNPQNPFNPSDDRIVCLALHCEVDARAGHSLDVGMWWRPQQQASPEAEKDLSARTCPGNSQTQGRKRIP